VSRRWLLHLAGYLYENHQIMDWLLDEFWSIWPWPLVVLLMLLPAGWGAYVWWLKRARPNRLSEDGINLDAHARPMGVNTRAPRIAWILGLAIFGVIAAGLSLKHWQEHMFATRALTNFHSIAALPFGDFNRDGKADMVLTVNGGVNVLLGKGDGTFQAPTTIVTGQGANSIKLADLNGDGNLDLALSNGAPSSGNAGDNDVVVILGNGDGTFQPAVKYTAGNNPFLAVVGDVNGDSKPDLIVVSDSGLNVLLGNGDGSFQIPFNSLRSSLNLRK
jgi:FG-GAP-like repeat